jgi:hypothetical protein
MRSLVLAVLSLVACSTSNGTRGSSFVDAAPSDASVPDAACAPFGGTFDCKPAEQACDTSLNQCPKRLEDVSLADLCASANNHVVHAPDAPCGGLTFIGYAGGVDCLESYYFDATTHALVAMVNECNFRAECAFGTVRCECVYGNVPTHDVCQGTDAGAWDAASE